MVFVLVKQNALLLSLIVKDILFMSGSSADHLYSTHEFFAYTTFAVSSIVEGVGYGASWPGMLAKKVGCV